MDKIMRKILVIHHSADLDGVFSAAIVKEALKERAEVKTLPYQYGEPIPYIDDEGYDEVYVVDVSFGKDTAHTFEHWIDRHVRVVWIDHHKTAIDSTRIPEGLDGIREVGVAACALTERFLGYPFTGGVPNDDRENDLIALLSDYDVWNHEGDWDRTEKFQYGMRSMVGLRLSMALTVLRMYANERNDEWKEFVNGTVEKGGAILDYLYNKNSGELDMFAFEATVLGRKALCMNTTEFSSATFLNMWDEDEFEVMMPFCWNGSCARCSLYTTREDVDCSEMAKSLGGGGHKQAAGFQLPFGEFVTFLRDKTI